MEKGILALWWRDLTPEVFDYIANCDSHGKILNHALHKEGNSEGKSRKRSRDDLGKHLLFVCLLLQIMSSAEYAHYYLIFSHVFCFCFYLHFHVFSDRKWR